jgi:hypothetical protein
MTHRVPHDLSERCEALNRRLLVLEQMFAAAALDPDGEAFKTTELNQFYYGLAEVVRDLRTEVKALGGTRWPSSLA